MTWFKMDDGFANSKPVLRIPRRYRLQAVGLWALAGTWSAKEETDGFIPEYVLEEFCGTPGIANQLVQAGLWEIVEGSSKDRVGILSAVSDNPQLPGWVFRNWGKYQPTKAELEENREKERVRKANYRKSQRDTQGTGAGQTEGHQQESGHPDPTRPDPTNTSTSAPAVLVTEKDFEQAWQYWPKKTERKKSLEKFKTVARRRGVDVLTADIRRFGEAYARTTDRQYVPALNVWLNGERWTDEPPTGQSKPQNRVPANVPKSEQWMFQ